MSNPLKFGEGLVFAHRETLAFAAAFPLVAAIPLLAEFAQHVVEMQIGMYAGPDAAKATADDPARLASGFIKALALSLPALWLMRFLASSGERDFTTRIGRPAIRLFALVFSLQALLAYLSLFVFTQGPVAIGFFVFGLLFFPLLSRFMVAAPLGRLVSPARSIRALLPHYIYAVTLPITAMLPLMAIHYGLGIGAIFVGPEWLKWTMLTFDSLVTAWLALVLLAANYAVAIRAGPLPQPPPEPQTA